MKRIICYIFLLIMVPMCAIAQSSMTDDQVMDKEHNNGTPQTQIVTKLMQSGVDITQIRRVRNKIERQMKQSGLGQTSGNQQIYDNSRMRTNNGQTRDELNTNTSQQTNLQRHYPHGLHTDAGNVAGRAQEEAEQGIRT